MINIVELSGRSKSKLIQFALDVGKVKTEKLQWPMWWSEKFDGCYCLALKHGGTVTIYSRTGEIYTSMQHIEAELNLGMSEDDIVIFEAFAPGIVQSTISGWCRDCKAQHRELQARCHTYITLNELIHGGVHDFYDTFMTMTEQFALADINYDIIGFAAQHDVLSMEEAMALTQEVWDRGGEGGVLRDPLAKFQGGKRNASIIKLKQGVSFDLQVIGVYEGTGKYVGNLGGLKCRWKDGGIINISGMTDAQRSLWWNAPHGIVGKVVQVDAMCLSSKGLLREPRFKGIRYDKSEGDF